MFDQSQEKQIKLRIIPRDGECGYTAIGKNREEVISVLRNNVSLDITDAIANNVAETADTGFNAWLRDPRHSTQDGASDFNAKVDEYHGDRSPEVLDGLKVYISVNPQVRQLYLNYNSQRAIFVHPQLLLKYAQHSGMQLYIWQLDRSDQLVPMRNDEGDFSSSHTDRATSRMDILFVNGNHFDRLETTGFRQDETLEGQTITVGTPRMREVKNPIVPIPLMPSLSTPSSPETVFASSPLMPADTGLLSWVDLLGQTRGRLAPPQDDPDRALNVDIPPSPDRNKTHPLTQDLMFAYVNQLMVVLTNKTNAIDKSIAPKTDKDVDKVGKIKAKIESLKKFTATSIGELFDNDFVQVLSIKRGPQLPNTFGEVVSETSVGFLRENPFSLMRQHAVLNALTKMTLSTEDERTVNEYLGLTCQVIEKIRPVLTGLYHQGEKLKDSMQSLMDFAQKNPDYASLIRVLFLLCFDISRYSHNERRKNLFNAQKLLTLKEWVFNSQTDIVPLDIEAFLRESAKQCHPHDLRLCLAALIEIDAATKYFDFEYTLKVHDAQTDAIRIHVGKFMHHYMPPVPISSPPELAEMSSIDLLSTGNFGQVISFKQALSSNVSFPTAFSPSMSLAFAWGTSSINPITLKTLALLSTEADLFEWLDALQKSECYPVGLLNSKMLEVINEFKSKPFNSENDYSFKIIDDVAVLGHENGVSSVEDFQKMTAYLYALLDFGKAVYYFWHSEYSKKATEAISDPLKALYAVTYSAVYYIQQFTNILGVFLLKLQLSSSDRQKKIEQLEKLQAQVKNFLEFVRSHIISSEETHNEIKTILGNHVDLSSPGFRTQLMTKIGRGDWEFVLQALFTLEHHQPQVEEDINTICRDIFKRTGEASWENLAPIFYDSQSSIYLHGLYLYYAVTLPNPPLMGCMKIAVFGFAYPSYATIPANRRLFAGLVIRAFSKIVSIEDSTIRDDRILHLTPNEKRAYTQALEYLLESQDILSAKEIDALKVIQEASSLLRADNQDLIDDLWIKAQQQEVVATLNNDAITQEQQPITHILGLEITLQSLKPRAKHKKHERAEQQALVERILVPGDGGKRPSDSGLPARPASIRITTETNKSDALQLEYQGLLDALAAGAFPETFEGRPVFYEQKTECKNLNFVQLKTLLHEKIKEKSKNFRIKLNSEQLTACVQEIYKSVSMKYTEFKNHGDQNPRDIRSILAGKHYNDRTLAVFAPQFAERLHIIQNECRDLPVAESDAPRTGVPSVQDDIDAISLDSIPSDIELDPEPEEDSDSTLDHGAGSAELNRAVLADAVKETIQWLLKPDPRPDNAPDALKNLIDVYQLTPQLIQEKRNELTRITVDYFKRRLAMIKAGKYHDCLKHIETYSTQDVPDELHYFICRLNFDIAAEKPSFEETKGEVANTLESIQDWRALPPYYREFLWVVVESFMIRTENRFDIDLTKLTGLSILLPDAIALGLYCYVQMTDVERSQNAATLLQTLAQLVLEEYQHHKPPNTTVRGKFIEDLEATQQIFSNPKNIGSDINRHALRLYYQIYTLMQIEFQAWNFNDSLFAKLILNELHLNMLAHPDYLEWHRNILDNRHYDSPVDHLLYHRITDGHTAQNARQFYWRYFEPNLTALQAQRYWWSDDYTNVAKQRSIKAPTFRAEATVVHIFFTLLTSASGNLIEIIAKNVRYYDDEKKKMCHHDQTLSIIDQVGFIFTLYNTPTTDSSPYGRASKLLRLDEHKDVLLLKAYQALTRLVNYEGETNQKKRDSHDRAYGIVSGYQVALLEDIKTILKTNDDIRDNYIKSLTIMATDSKEPEPMAADVFAFICSVLRKDRPEPWSPVKRTLFSTSSSTKKSNSNNTAPNLLRRRINPESYSLLLTNNGKR